MEKNENKRVYYITIVSILSGISTIFFFIGGVPIFVAFPYLKIDLSDIPALIGGIIINPEAGLLIELIKSGMHLMRTQTMGIGEIMSLIVGNVMVISFCYPLNWMNGRYKKKFFIFNAYIVCLFFTVLIAIVANLILYPLFMLLLNLEKTTKVVMISYLIAVLIINIIKVTITVVGSLVIIKIGKLDQI